MVPVDQVIGPKTVIKIEGQGMPIYKPKRLADEDEESAQE
jgi:hypothetical protein